MRALRRTLGALCAVTALAAPSPATASNAELVTVTKDSATATWTTAEPSDTVFCIGRSSAAERCSAQETGVRLHYATLDGLEPGVRYAYELRSAGAAEPVSDANPGSFVTLTPPPGRHLFDFAVLNDLHVGEECAGTATSAPLLGTSIPACFSAPAYAERMDSAIVAEIAGKGIDLTLVNGDVTAEARPEEAARAKEVLAGLPGQVLVARGNHDRVHADRPSCGADGDCFRSTFYPGRAPGRIYGSADSHGVHFVWLDSVKGSSTGDLTDDAQNAWFGRDLAANRRKPTFVFFHHPASEYADTLQSEPVIFGVPPTAGGAEFLSTVAANPQIVGVFQAHTHRNFNSYGREAGSRTPFVENGTSKEYPGGYSVVSVYEGGYTRSYFRPRDCEFCREWTETTRGEYQGAAPEYLLGSLGTRNFSHVHDCPGSPPAQSVAGNESLATGGVATPPAACLDRVRRPPGTDPPGASGTGASPGGASLSVAAAGRTVRIRRGRGVLRLRCRSGGPCRARGRMVGRVGRRHAVTLARIGGIVPDAATGTVRVALTRTGRRLLRRSAPVRGRARIAVAGGSGQRRRVGGRLVLRRAR